MKKIFLISVILLMFVCISTVSAYENQTTLENNFDYNCEILQSDETTDNSVVDDMNNPNQEHKTPTNNNLVADDMNNPNRNSTQDGLKLTYFSNTLTNIQKETAFKIILKTTNTNSNGVISDTNGIPLSNKNIIITVNGLNYTRTTDSDGIAKLNINLNHNNYIITASYGTSTSQTSPCEMICVTSGIMNMAYSSADYNKSAYITPIPVINV